MIVINFYINKCTFGYYFYYLYIKLIRFSYLKVYRMSTALLLSKLIEHFPELVRPDAEKPGIVPT